MQQPIATAPSARVLAIENAEYNAWREQLRQNNIAIAQNAVLTCDSVEAYQSILNCVGYDYQGFDKIGGDALIALNALYGESGNPFDKPDIHAMLGSLQQCGWIAIHSEPLYRGDYLAGTTFTYRRTVPEGYLIVSTQ